MAAGTVKLSYTTTSNGATSATVSVTMTYYGNGETYDGAPTPNNCWIRLNGTTKYFTHGYTTSSSAQTMGSASFTIGKTNASQSLTATGGITNYSSVYNNPTGSCSVSVSAKTSYTVSYNANGGSGAPSSQTKWYGETLTLSTTQPTRTGYTFDGWNTNASGTGTDYSVGDTYTANSALTLYAKWTPITYTVSYNANGGTNAPSSQTKTHGIDLTLTSDTPTRSGFNFIGWATSSEGAVAYSPSGTYSTNANVELYAVWVSAYQPPQILNAKVVRCNISEEEIMSGEYVKVSFDWVAGIGADGTTHESLIKITGGLSYIESSTEVGGSISQKVGIALGSTNTAVISIKDTDENVMTDFSVVFPRGGVSVHISRPEKAVRFFGIAEDDDEGVISEDYIVDVDFENTDDPLVGALNDLNWASLITRFGVGIKGVLAKILNAIKSLQDRDYIVEQGTDGIWTYRKWNSGIAECWGYTSTASLTWTVYANTSPYTLYFSNSWNFSLPFAFTDTSYVINANCLVPGSNYGWVARGSKATTGFTLNIVRNGNTGTCYMDVTVKGRWK